MLVYTFTARDPLSGERVKSEVEATDERSAAKILQDRGLAPIEIKLKGQEGGKVSFAFRNRVKAKDKVLFSRQMSSLLGAGIPLVQSLRMVSDQVSNKRLKTVIGSIATDIESGASFSKALAKHPDIFDHAFRGVISAGETTGGVSEAMVRLADQQERDADAISKIRGALIYPAVVILVIIAVATFMVVKVLPQVQSLYKGFPGSHLPFFTNILLGVSHIVISFWWLILGLLAATAFFSFKWSRTLTGKRFLDGAKLHTPPLDRLYQKLYMARFARNLGTMMASGVPMLQSLEITSEAIGNVHVADSISKAAVKVRGGKALSECLKSDPNFLDLVPSMLQIGEKSGTVAPMMEKTAEYYENELEREIKNITTIVEPALMVLMGVIALVLVAAILLPIYGLVGKIQ